MIEFEQKNSLEMFWIWSSLDFPQEVPLKALYGGSLSLNPQESLLAFFDRLYVKRRRNAF